MVMDHPVSAQEPPGGGLSKADHELLATAIANGQGTVTLLIAAKGGAAKQVVNGVQAVGGTLRIDAGPGRGTRIIGEIPIRRE